MGTLGLCSLLFLSLWLSLLSALAFSASFDCSGYVGLSTVTVSSFSQLNCAILEHVSNITVNASFPFSSEIYVSWTGNYFIKGDPKVNLYSSTSRLFNITSTNLFSLENLILSAKPPSGVNGGIIYTSDSNLLLNEVEMSSSTADCGAAVFAQSSVVQVQNSYIHGNVGSSTGQCGGAVNVIDSTFKSWNCSWQSNEAAFGGALFGQESDLFVSSSQFTSNSVRFIGGAVYSLSSTLFIGESTFSDNSASVNGGALGLQSTTANFTSLLCSRNSADTFGGCLYSAQSNFSIVGSTVTTCEANSGGGLYLQGGKGKIGTTRVDNNLAQVTGAGLVCNNAASVDAEYTRFESNTAISIGGSISAEGQSSLTMRNCLFSNSTVARSGSPISIGGAINCQYASVSIMSSEMSFNSANQGGDVFAFYCTLSMQQMLMHDSEADEGSVYAFGSSLSFGDSIMTNNTGQSSCAGIYCKDTLSCIITRSNFTSNRASELGVLTVDTATSNVTDCMFVDNLSDGLSGAIYVISSPSTSIDRCDFVRNAASTYGGAVAAEIDSYLYIRDSVYSNNYAVSGGALYLFHRSVASLSNSSFFSNAAANSGGALYMGDNAMLHAENVYIYNSSAATGGGLYATYASYLDVSDLRITSCYAGYSGKDCCIYDGCIPFCFNIEMCMLNWLINVCVILY
jgi:predicted outer membrane repeat protein